MKRKPVILQDILVEDYAAEGKSLARVDGKVVFIENTIPGDVVDVYLYKSKKDWAEGWPMSIKKTRLTALTLLRTLWHLWWLPMANASI